MTHHLLLPICLLLVLLTPISAQTPTIPSCPSEYNPVCCHTPTEAKTRTKANKCWCASSGGFPLYIGHCRSWTPPTFNVSTAQCPDFSAWVCCTSSLPHAQVSSNDECRCRGTNTALYSGKCSFGPYLDPVCCIASSGDLVSYRASQWCQGTVLWSGQCQTACFKDTGPVCCAVGFAPPATVASRCWCENVLRGRVRKEGRCKPAPIFAKTPACGPRFKMVCCNVNGRAVAKDSACLCKAAAGVVLKNRPCSVLPAPAKERRPVLFCDPLDPIPVCCQSTLDGRVQPRKSRCECAASKGSVIDSLIPDNNCTVGSGSLRCGQRFKKPVCCRDAKTGKESASINECACVEKSGVVLYTGACDARKSRSVRPDREVCADRYDPVCCRSPYFKHLKRAKNMLASNKCWCHATGGYVLSMDACKRSLFRS